MGSRESPCYNVARFSLRIGSPINYGNYIVLVFIFVSSVLLL
jgi:hypothetical protein